MSASSDASCPHTFYSVTKTFGRVRKTCLNCGETDNQDVGSARVNPEYLPDNKEFAQRLLQNLVEDLHEAQRKAVKLEAAEQLLREVMSCSEMNPVMSKPVAAVKPKIDAYFQAKVKP